MQSFNMFVALVMPLNEHHLMNTTVSPIMLNDQCLLYHNYT